MLLACLKIGTPDAIFCSSSLIFYTFTSPSRIDGQIYPFCRCTQHFYGLDDNMRSYMKIISEEDYVALSVIVK